MAGFEGELTFRVVRRGDGVDQLCIDSSRPLQAARIFRGKTVDQTLTMLPLLYSVCGTAQAQAAVSALEQAQGGAPDQAVSIAREMLVWLETAREHLWRMMIDWPVFIGEDTARQQLAPLMRLLPETRRALFAEAQAFLPGAVLSVDTKRVELQFATLRRALRREVCGCSSEQWLSMTSPSAIEQWIDQGQTVAARLLRRVRDNRAAACGAAQVAGLPPLDGPLLAQYLAGADADNFIARPTWQGRVYETTPLARQREQALIASSLESHGNGLMTRLLARLVELAQIPAVLRRHLDQLDAAGERVESEVLSTSEGVGLAQVEAARGRLIHRVEVTRGIIRDYRILAPTEWNFHPEGVLAQGFKSLQGTGADDLEWRCKLLINAVDPCVGYSLRLE